MHTTSCRIHLVAESVQLGVAARSSRDTNRVILRCYRFYQSTNDNEAPIRATTTEMIVVAIDIGLTNLGFVKVRIRGKDDYECLVADLVDTTTFTCDQRTCKLRHSACHVDWIDHLLQRYRADFDEAEVVLIERQPPQGHKAPEQLLYAAMRDKAVLIHPRSFLAWVGIGSMDYELRKEAIVRRAKRIYKDDVAQAALKRERAHDIGDGLNFVDYHVATDKTMQRRFEKPIPPLLCAAFDHLEQFRFCGKRKRDILPTDESN